MAFDKAKVVRAAERSLAQGKIAAAIKEYRLIVDNDPDDFTALNMLGDLSARNGKNQEAISCFRKIANHYREQGFALKAIAMFKKIDKLQPNDPATANTLGALYEMQGLVVDARAQYMTVAEAFQRASQPEKALEVLKKVADLEPNNTTIRIKLAEGYLHENLRREAGEAFAEAGERLLSRRSYESALDCFNQTLKIDPRNQAALNGILGAHIALGTADEAAEVLETAQSMSPNNVDLLSMLARAYIAADDAARAEEVTKSLVLLDDSSYPRFLEVAQLYLNEDKTENTVKILSEVADHVLAAGEVERFMRILDEILARNPEHIDSLRLLVRVYKWQCDDAKIRAALERLVESAESLGLIDVERHALAQLAQLVPDVRYLDRLEAIGGAPQEMFGESSTSLRQNIAVGVPTFESFALVDEAHAPAGDYQEVSFVEHFETNGDTQTSAGSDASFADLNEDFPVESEVLFETNNADSYVSNTPAAAPAEKGSTQESLVRQELESVDFYIAQGYLDIAADTLDMLERQFGAHPAIDERRQLLAGSGDAGPKHEANTVDFSVPEELVAPVQDDIQQLNADAFMFMPETVDQVPEISPQADFSQNLAYVVEPESIVEPEAKPASKPGGIDPGLAAIFDEFREAMEDDDEPAGDGDFETHYNMGLAYKEMDLADQAVEEFQQAAGMVSPADGTARYLQCCNMLGHCFMQKQMPRLAVMWFKKGLELPAHSEDEYQALRYELGIAYELDGELDKAIDVFTEVYGVDVSYRGVAGKLRELQAQRAIK